MPSQSVNQAWLQLSASPEESRKRVEHRERAAQGAGDAPCRHCEENLNAIVTCGRAKKFCLAPSFVAPYPYPSASPLCYLMKFSESYTIGQAIPPFDSPYPSCPYLVPLLDLTPSGKCKQFQITTTKFSSINKLARGVRAEFKAMSGFKAPHCSAFA